MARSTKTSFPLVATGDLAPLSQFVLLFTMAASVSGRMRSTGHRVGGHLDGHDRGGRNRQGGWKLEGYRLLPARRENRR